ncbi:alkaline phosphatase [bacterium]|nr:alkaline phosphatase [bacterium]
MPRALLATLLALLIAGPSPAAAEAPRNLILMIADGAGYDHFRAASYHATGRADAQAVWRFPVQAALSTFPAGGHYDPELAWSSEAWLGHRVTDSAASITALTTGVKTHNKRLCVGPDGERLTTITERLEASGRATGVVSSVMFTHATPAGFAISHPARKEYAAIARKMLAESAIDVIMGPGHPLFDDDGRRVRTPDYRLVGGHETWRALMAGELGADADADGRPDPWTVVESREAFVRLAGEGQPPTRVLGLPRVRETLQEQRGGDARADAFAVPLTAGIPTLAEMSRAALNVLVRHDGGFGVMIEGGAVDWASHDAHAGRMIEEQRDFDLAVEAVIGWLDEQALWDQTLLIVTSDHECGHLCAPDGDGPIPAVTASARGEMPAMEFRTGKHTHALVPLFARGPGADGLIELADDRDPVRGPYLDSAELGGYLVDLVATHAGHAMAP